MSVRTPLISALILALASQVSAAASPQGFAMLNSAMSLKADPQHGEVLYLKHCTRCHSPRAWGKGVFAVPSLAGQREFYLIQQLVQFATLGRNVPEMHAVLAAPDLDRPQSIRDLAAYLAFQARNPRVEHGDGHSLKEGELIYKRSCAMCHGKNGEGSEDEPIPAVGGQHYDYLRAQLDGFATGHRGTVEPPIIDFTAGLTPQQRHAVADYISRLTALQLETTR